MATEIDLGISLTGKKFLKGAPGLFGDAIPVTLPSRITHSRTGIRKSYWNDQGNVDQDRADNKQIGAHNFTSYITGITNLVNSDFSDTNEWQPSGAGEATGFFSDCIGSIVFDGSGAVVMRNPIAGLTGNRWARCQARLVYGEFTGGELNDYFAFRNNGSRIGTAYDLGNLTEEWQTINCFTDVADTTNELVFRSANSVKTKIEIRFLCAADVGFPPLSTACGLDGLIERNTKEIYEWNTGQSVTVGLENVGNGVARLTEGTTTAQKLAESDISVVDGVPCTFTIEAKADGTDYIGVQMPALTQFATVRISLIDGSIIFGDQFFDSVSSEHLGEGWYRLTAVVESANGSWTNFCKVLMAEESTYDYQGDGRSSILLRNASIKYGLPYDSPQSTSYGDDLGEISLPNTPVGAIVTVGIPFGYDGGETPNSNVSRVYEGQMIQTVASGSGPTDPTRGFAGGFVDLLNGSDAFTDGQPLVAMHTWDGAERTFRTNNNAPNTVASSDTLTAGSMRVGNNTGMDRCFQGLLCMYLFPRIPTDQEYSAIVAELLSAGAEAAVQ